ncbi:MAG TPA: hypothetical protein VFB14_09935 [Bryobacteraceae bacterium]|jgi:hypothetical protein|nr:hypothetical protein [Bryobacteraceae bacterium]
MFTSAILDNLIALIVSILALCLVVQATQQALKKLLKIKSRQLEESLVDLFENVLGAGVADQLAVSPVLNLILRRRTSIERAAPEVRALYFAVMREFQKIGRVSQAGKVMLDSIAKDDLLKVVRKIAPGTLMPGNKFDQTLQSACEQITAIDQILNSPGAAQLTGVASAKFAEVKDRLIPIITDFSNLASHGQINPGLVIEHVLEMRQVGLANLFDLLSELQDAIENQAASAGPQAKADLEALLAALRTLPPRITALRQHLDAALAPLRTRMREIENWFDTVMQSFDERYARGMKTWGIVISFLIVIVMNANVFEVYNRITASESTRNALVQMAGTVSNRVSAQNQSNPNQSNNDLQESLREIQNNLALYQQFQFQPLTWQDVNAWRAGRNYPAGQGFWQHRGQDLRILVGWVLMTLLLSVGAPFWQDTLEAVFGVKNLIRRRGAIQNVETPSGTGNPKS